MLTVQLPANTRNIRDDRILRIVPDILVLDYKPDIRILSTEDR